MTPVVLESPSNLPPQLITEKFIYGHIARFVCTQSPYGSVQGVDNINRTIREAIDSGEYGAWPDGFSDLRMRYFETFWDLENWLKSVLQHDLTCKMLNTPRKPRPHVDWMPFMNAGIFPPIDNNPDYDFIDLDAMFRNVAIACFKEARD